jgi:hypothetical protein
MQAYIFPVTALALVWYTANKHEKGCKKASNGSGNSAEPLIQFGDEQLTPQTEQPMVPRTEYPISGALAWGVPSIDKRLANSWSFF